VGVAQLGTVQYGTAILALQVDVTAQPTTHSSCWPYIWLHVLLYLLRVRWRQRARCTHVPADQLQGFRVTQPSKPQLQTYMASYVHNCARYACWLTWELQSGRCGPVCSDFRQP